MNLALFFEGTGQGVAGRFTNVTRLQDACVADGRQALHLEGGPGTHFGAYLLGRIAGLDGQRIFRAARRWFEGHYARRAPDGVPMRVFLFGFSRGALLARHFAAWLERLDVPVAYLGLWDTVDAMPGLSVSETCPANVACARHAVARDERRRFFAYVPLRAPAPAGSALHAPCVSEQVFPGCHSDVGGIYPDNHRVADVALAWIAAGAVRAGLRLKSGVRLRQRCEPDEVVLHDSSSDISNVWGVLGTVTRILKGVRPHRLTLRLESPSKG